MSADVRPKTRIPPLRHGQRLTRAEFMRRWEAMPELKHAERIEGKVDIMTPPISFDHSDPHSFVVWCLMTYRRATPGVRSLNETTTHVDGDNDFQPDAGLVIDPLHGGQTRYAGKYLEGAPELVVEVAESSLRKDMGIKLEIYRRAGVLEYLVWHPSAKAINCFRNRAGQFVPADLEGGVFKSNPFPGLWLNVPALVAEDLDAVWETLSAGLADPAHAKFKRKLARAKKG